MRERGREREPAQAERFPWFLPAPDSQYGNEVDVQRKKWHFLPDHQDLEGQLD